MKYIRNLYKKSYILLACFSIIMLLAGCFKEHAAFLPTELSIKKVLLPEFVELDLNDDEYEDIVCQKMDKEYGTKKILFIYSGKDNELIYQYSDMDKSYYFLSSQNYLIQSKIEHKNCDAYYFYAMGVGENWESEILSGIVLYDVTDTTRLDDSWLKEHPQMTAPGIYFEDILSQNKLYYSECTLGEAAIDMGIRGLNEAVSARYFDLLSCVESKLTSEDFLVQNANTVITLDSAVENLTYDASLRKTDTSGEQYLKVPYGSSSYYYCWPLSEVRYYEGIEIGLSNVNYEFKERTKENMYVSYVMVTDKFFRTTRGISVDSSMEDVLLAYGEGILWEAQTDRDCFVIQYQHEDMMLEFVINEESRCVVKIIMSIIPQYKENEHILLEYNVDLLDIRRQLYRNNPETLNELTKDNPQLLDEILENLPRYATSGDEILVTDMNQDGNWDILFRETKGRYRTIQPFERFYSCEPGNIVEIDWDEVDSTEYSYYSSNGNIIYAAHSFGTRDLLYFRWYYFDENWEVKNKYSLYVYIVPEWFLKDYPEWAERNPDMAVTGDYFYRSDKEEAISYEEFCECLDEMGLTEEFTSEYEKYLIGNYDTKDGEEN